MAEQTTSSIIVDATPTQVMAVIADFAAYPEWAQGMKEAEVVEEGADGRAEQVSMPFRYVWPAELDLMAQLAGMGLSERWSGWRREPFTSDSRRHVSVWRKP